ncbi:MAG: hypothetical protein PWQ10_349 [Patescibacteria group bacterium]|nr:hypothetical protein [Patescibacteria group bacterium]
MTKPKFSRIIPIALILIIVAVSIAALVSLARTVFFSGTIAQKSVDISKESLLNTSVNYSVALIVRGPIVANESFSSYQIKVAPNSRSLTVYSGYLNQISNNIVLDNNIPAYEQFVYALDKANMEKGTELSGNKNDLRGICASGFVYEYKILKSDSSIKSLWSSSCSGSRGSLDASVNQLNKLFMAQIPDSSDIINKIW